MIRRDRVFQTTANIIMIVLMLYCMLPLLLLFASSITEERALIVNGYSFWRPGSTGRLTNIS